MSSSSFNLGLVFRSEFRNTETLNSDLTQLQSQTSSADLWHSLSVGQRSSGFVEPEATGYAYRVLQQ